MSAESGTIGVFLHIRGTKSTLIEKATIHPSKMTKILFLTASPRDKQSLQIDKEIRAISQAIQGETYGTSFEIIIRTSVKRDQLLKFIEDEKPDIIHFSGHGNSNSEICLEDDLGETHPVDKAAMREIFSLVKQKTKRKTRCIVLNACYMEAQANAIADTIDGVVVGTLGKISDDAAISFAKEFYRQIACGQDVLYAYHAGKTQFNQAENLLRIHSVNVKPNTIIFVTKTETIQAMSVGGAIGAAASVSDGGIVNLSSSEDANDFVHSEEPDDDDLEEPDDDDDLEEPDDDDFDDDDFDDDDF